MANLQSYEFTNNALLKELRSGGELHAALAQCRPFDGLLLPPQHTFESEANNDAKNLHKSTAFLQRHLLRFSGSEHLSQQFVTLDGLRGCFSDTLDSITLHHISSSSATAAAANTTPQPQQQSTTEQLLTSQILRHCPPDATVASTDMQNNVPASLNIFLIAEPLAVEEELKQFAATVGSPTEAKVDGKEPGKISNTLDMLFSGITNVFDKASIGSGSPKPSPNKEALSKQVSTTAVSASTSKFQAFQKRMQAPESKPLVKKVGQFIQKHQTKEGPTTGDEVKQLIRSVMLDMKAIPLWTSGDDATDIAAEGLEKYITSKLYDKCFCVNPQERRENASLMRKIAALRQVVTSKNLDCPNAPVDIPDWQKAKEELQQMNSYKCPRDKLVCGTNACVHITNALRGGAEAVAAGKGDLSDKGADDYLPCVMLCVLEANPENFLSNIAFICEFRANDRIESETQYNLTVLQSAVHFWLTCQAPELKMTTEEFDVALNNIFALKKAQASQPSTGGDAIASLGAASPSACAAGSDGTMTPPPMGGHIDPSVQSLPGTPTPMLGTQMTAVPLPANAANQEELTKLREQNAAMVALLKKIAEAGANNRYAGSKPFEGSTVAELRDAHRVSGEVFVPLAREVAQYLNQYASNMPSRNISPTDKKQAASPDA